MLPHAFSAGGCTPALTDEGTHEHGVTWGTWTCWGSPQPAGHTGRRSPMLTHWDIHCWWGQWGFWWASASSAQGTVYARRGVGKCIVFPSSCAAPSSGQMVLVLSPFHILPCGDTNSHLLRLCLELNMVSAGVITSVLRKGLPNPASEKTVYPEWHHFHKFKHF